MHKGLRHMSDLSAFEITKKWPAADPSVIQLYSYPTPNGVKASIMLEEVGLPYEPHLVTLSDADVKSPEFLSLNPNNKIPAIIDPNGPDGAPIGLFESGAILIYLAEKTGMLLGETATERLEAIKWLMFQMGGVGPMFGQMGFFVAYAGKAIEDPRPRERYVNEAKRLLSVIDAQLEGRDYLTGSYTIADVATVPWLAAIAGYGAQELVEWDSYKNLNAYIARVASRPTVEKARSIPNPQG